MSDPIVLGDTVRAAGRRDGHPGSRGRIIYAVSADRRWEFYAEYGAWTAVHADTGRALTHAGTSLQGACVSEARLVAELERAGVPV